MHIHATNLHLIDHSTTKIYFTLRSKVARWISNKNIHKTLHTRQLQITTRHGML